MVWSRTTREQYKREAVGYASDLTAAEWGLIEPLIPRQGRMGRPLERESSTQSSTGWQLVGEPFPPVSPH